MKRIKHIVIVSSYKKKGSKIRMAMEKSQKPRENANVFGEVDFR